jgi:transglutaminase-like putative cysteine protease
MPIRIETSLDYHFPAVTDVLLQLEAAMIPEQLVQDARLTVSECAHFARVPGHDTIGERIWLRVEGNLTVDYCALVKVNRILGDVAGMKAIPTHQLPGETVEYLMPSRYCPSDDFMAFVDAEFGGLAGGARVAAMKDWIASQLTYTLGSSSAATTAVDTFVRRQGVCRDYAHLLVTLTRASAIPARIASVYAPDLNPPDFHAVAEVFLGGAWHLVDATGMAKEADMVKIGVGRDAADIAFLTAYGTATLNRQSVSVVAE